MDDETLLIMFVMYRLCINFMWTFSATQKQCSLFMNCQKELVMVSGETEGTDGG